ncbi:MAG: hypothetical protein BWY78_00091 [Alphaproteobacteria bacterium ADurb.Bin438]|nr:MAG: hypothetical protein BWY78_00091 [Alphaproteobacteria bacterium ADurb.Bin438]
MIFDKDLNRLKLISCKSDKAIHKKIKISVFRNHAFEMVASVINKFLNFSNVEASFDYSDYDDSFNFIIPNDDIDISILWIDLSRYKNIDVKVWLKERLLKLKTLTKSKIILYHTGEINDITFDMDDLVVANFNEIKSFLKNDAFDEEKIEYSGTRLSNKACLYVARELGLRYIPACVFPCLKAIVIDLDNTFYKGVLGEDGFDKISVYTKFQEKLKTLKERGFLLAVISKNEMLDVKEMFEKRNDFKVSFDDFVDIQANWDLKSNNMMKILKKLNIGEDSVIYIDDNPGEIQNMKNSFPFMNFIEFINEEKTLDILEFFPRIFKSKISKEDNLRTNDIKANKIRKNSSLLSDEDYFKSLEIKLKYEIDDEKNVKRISELLNKTNQFIFNYKRYNENEISKIIKDDSYKIITCSLSDKLSDSGIIAIFILKKNDEILELDELVISCRALGRRIETKMIKYAFVIAKQSLNTKNNIKITCLNGERNLPARLWINETFGTNMKEDIISFETDVENEIDMRGIKVESSI